MACKGCKEKKAPEIEQHVTMEVEDGVRKYSFPKRWITVEWKSMIDALVKAKQILHIDEFSEEEK